MPSSYVEVSEGDLVLLESQMFRDRYTVATISKVTPETVVTHPWKDSENRFLTTGIRRSRRSVEGLIPVLRQGTPEEVAAAVYLSIETARKEMELTRKTAETTYRNIALGHVVRNTEGSDV